MLYEAVLTKKKKLFQKPYVINKNKIIITDTKRAKTKFLKSKITDVVFDESFKNDGILTPFLKPLYAYDKSFLAGFSNQFIEHMILFFKMKPPLDEIAVFSPLDICRVSEFARLVTVVGNGEGDTLGGVNIRYVKNLTSMPNMAFVTEKGWVPPGVPVIDLRESAQSGHNTSTWQTMSFKCSLLDREINAPGLICLLKEHTDMAYELTGLRKKLPTLFTFC